MKVVEIPFIACLLLVILQINIAFARLRAADESTGKLKLSENKFYLDPTLPQTLPDEKGFKSRPPHSQGGLYGGARI